MLMSLNIIRKVFCKRTCGSSWVLTKNSTFTLKLGSRKIPLLHQYKKDKYKYKYEFQTDVYKHYVYYLNLLLKPVKNKEFC